MSNILFHQLNCTKICWLLYPNSGFGKYDQSSTACFPSTRCQADLGTCTSVCGRQQWLNFHGFLGICAVQQVGAGGDRRGNTLDCTRDHVARRTVNFRRLKFWFMVHPLWPLCPVSLTCDVGQCLLSCQLGIRIFQGLNKKIDGKALCNL